MSEFCSCGPKISCVPTLIKEILSFGLLYSLLWLFFRNCHKPKEVKIKKTSITFTASKSLNTKPSNIKNGISQYDTYTKENKPGKYWSRNLSSVNRLLSKPHNVKPMNSINLTSHWIIGQLVGKKGTRHRDPLKLHP